MLLFLPMTNKFGGEKFASREAVNFDFPVFCQEVQRFLWEFLWENYLQNGNKLSNKTVIICP